MQKVSKKIYGALLLILLTGCVSNNTSLTSSNSSSPVNSTNTVSTSNNSTSTNIVTSSSVISSTSTNNSSSDDFPYYSEISSDCSTRDGLIDIDLGLAVATNTELQIGFGFSDITTEGAIVTTSHPDVLQYEYKGGKHILKGLKEGKSYLIIKDYEGYIHYRKVVNVKDELSEEEIYNHLFEVDTWYSWFSASTLVFLENKTGIYKESDGFSVTGSFEFKYELEKIDRDKNEFVFTFTEVSEKTIDYTPTGFNVSLTGDIIHLQDTNMTSDILQAHKSNYGSWN